MMDKEAAMPLSAMDMEALSQAIKTFDDTTARLSESNSRLQHNVDYLSTELQNKNEMLKEHVVQLDNTQKYLNRVLESISDGVIVCDIEGKFKTCNKKAQIMVSASRRDMLEMSYDNIFPSLAAEDKTFLQIARTISLQDQGLDLELSTEKSTHVPVILFMSLLTNEHCEITGVVITIHDMSKVRKLENEVERSKRLVALGEMVAGVAHEIRNPLGGIEMYASMLGREFKDDESKTSIIKQIIHEVRGLNKTVTEMLTFTRSFEKTNFKVLDIIDTLEEVMTFAAKEIQQRGIEVIKKYKTESPQWVYGDADHLRQVFLNIILNAAQAIDHENGVLSIGGSIQDGLYSISIDDNGSGIPHDSMDKIFDPFFTTKTKGTGLGLAISYRIIEAHGGSITVESIEGQGARFIVGVPVREGVTHG